MAFDPTLGKVVLFGGSTNETWTFDGTTWTQLSPAARPPANTFGSMVFDPAIGKLVLFGGVFNGVGISNATWTFDGSTWAQLSPTTSPPARIAESLAFDGTIGKVVLFGGADSLPPITTLKDTWTFDGTTWTQLSPATSPPAQFGTSMVDDPPNGRVLLFGGGNDTWAFDGTTWTEETPTPSPTHGGFMAYDTAIGKAILFATDGTTWSLATGFHITTDSLPPASRGVAYSYQLQAAGGVPPYAFKRISGLLPKGLRLNRAGLISGTPRNRDNAGNYTFTAQARDSTTRRNGGKQMATKAFTLTLQ